VKKFLPYMGAAIATLAMTWSVQASAQDMFKDVPSDHWAYAAISDLQQKKILLGYPNGYFQGKRVLTRYEFAVALKRALDAIGPGVKGDKGDPGAPGATGPAGADGAAGPAGPPGMTPEQVEALMKLADTFKAELTQLGTDVKAINQRLDALAKSVDAINARLDKMVTLNGEFFTGFRGDLSRNPYVDYGGAARAANSSPFANVDAPMDFHLIAHANLAGGVKFVGDIVESNYLDYATLGLAGTGTFGGGTAHASGGPLQTNLYQAELMIPIGQFGSKTVLELGRFKDQITPLTYMRPDTDPYFNLPWYSDGNYVEDGFKLSSKFGSATTQLFAGSYRNLGSSNNVPLNSVFLGSTNSGGAFVGTMADQSAGLHVALPLMKVGEIGLTILDFSGPASGIGTEGGITPGAFTNEVVYGANFALHPIGRLNISAEVAKSVTQLNINHADGNSNDDDNAYNIHASYKSGALGVLAGYQYIDPRYSAPGYWDKVGSIYNPTNVQGPYTRLSYKFTDKLNGSVGGEYLEGARNRPGFTMGSNVGKAEAGLKYMLNKTVHLSADYEGDFYNLSAAVAGTRANAWQQFITLGAGVNLTGNTVLKFGYQVLANQDKLGITGFTGPNPTNNANVFTTSVTVHF
jgi:hypothetical protein